MTTTTPKTVRPCDGCFDSFEPEGHETLCPTCELNEVFRRSCKCGTWFMTDDLDRWECSFCGDDTYNP